jgi:teichuronic acid biosynthesis glycosyltransferase TuaG
MNINSNKVSVITASFNSDRFIKETYQSIIAQEYTEWEWIVTDDCSSDGTVGILDAIAASDIRVKVIKNSVNLGAGFSRNKSMSQASGRFFAFIDADDLWEPQKLSRQVAFMLTGHIGFSFTSYRVIGQCGEDQGKVVDRGVPISVGYNDLLAKKATVGCSTVMVDRSLVGEFVMPGLRTGQDYVTWLSILKRGFTGYLLKDTLTSYRIVEGSISRNKFKKALRQWHIYRSSEELSFGLSVFYFFNYAIRAVVKK